MNLLSMRRKKLLFIGFHQQLFQSSKTDAWNGLVARWGLKTNLQKTIFTHSGVSKSSLRGLASVKECVSVIVEVCAGESVNECRESVSVLECVGAGVGACVGEVVDAGSGVEVWD